MQINFFILIGILSTTSFHPGIHCYQLIQIGFISYFYFVGIVNTILELVP